jgi:hypothetical protein
MELQLKLNEKILNSVPLNFGFFFNGNLKWESIGSTSLIIQWVYNESFFGRVFSQINGV